MDMTLPVPMITHPRRETLWGRMLARMFGQAASGTLLIEGPDRPILVRQGMEEGPAACIRIERRRAILRALLGGEHGAARAFIDGDWSSRDLVSAMRYFARNDPADASALLAAPRRWLERARHLRNANTRRGSRRNIEFHYDLGNDFFRLWLDESMAYSSALWRDEAESLPQAQRNKLGRVADLLGPLEGRSVLEIGCGWGAQARLLAERGAQVKGITLSPSQLAYAQELMDRHGLTPAVQLALQDYRDEQGQYDAVVSIEMAEAVGEENLAGYFDTVRRSLKPGGRAVLQVITIAEDRLEGYRRRPDFIQRYIFPGGFLPSRSLLVDKAAAAGLDLHHHESFGQSYARTLAEWRQRFDAAWPKIAAQGFDERFRRLWTYYLCYCEAGFAEGAIDVGFFVLTRDD